MAALVAVLVALVLALAVLAAAGVVFLWPVSQSTGPARGAQETVPREPPGGAGTSPTPPAGEGDTSDDGAGAPRVEVVASGLEVPWDMAFDRDGNLFFTERPGRVRLWRWGGEGRPVLLATLEDTAAVGEGGLLGLALHPRFPDEPFLYVYQTYRTAGRIANRVLRFRFDAGGPSGPRLLNPEVVLDGIPAAAIHDGGQLEFGPDGKLYVSTGDAGQPRRAQDPDSLHGKILRLNPDGSVPPDNPLGSDNPVYSLGHRNPEGLAFHPGTGALYAVEHGPDAWDEVNLIEPGTNYGWPVMVGPDHDNYASPLRAYDPIIAPATADFYTGPIREWNGSLFFGTLGFSADSAGRHLHRIRFGPDGRTVAEEEVLFRGGYGRIRAVKTGPDGCLYFGTSNRDGRGDPAPEDDRILRACPR